MQCTQAQKHTGTKAHRHTHKSTYIGDLASHLKVVRCIAIGRKFHILQIHTQSNHAQYNEPMGLQLQDSHLFNRTLDHVHEWQTRLVSAQLLQCTLCALTQLGHLLMISCLCGGRGTDVINTGGHFILATCT